MKQFMMWFFMVLGVIFFIILLSIGYIFATNTFGIRALFSKSSTTESTSTQTTTTKAVDKNPLIPAPQEKALEAIGVDPTKLPTTITPAMSACFDQKLGTARTLEIKNGSSPTAAEFLIAKACF